MQSDFYRTIQTESVAEFKDRGSRFIAYAIPVNSQAEIDSMLKRLKSEHPKAVHHCYAYRLGIDKLYWRANDDGEPSGSAGRPILGQIDSFQVTNVLIVVVRYFGGVLLGVPGLIHAYKTASKMALEQATIIQKQLEKKILINVAYEHHFKVLQALKRHAILFEMEQLDNPVIIRASVPLSILEKLKTEVKEFAIIDQH